MAAQPPAVVSTDVLFAQYCNEVYNLPTDFTSNQGEHVNIRTVAGIKSFIFRGSENFNDWFHDFDVIPFQVNMLGVVHKGFYDYAMSVLPFISANLKGGEKFCLSGHSLGGAAAVIAGALLAKVGRSPAGLVTFGAPNSHIGSQIGNLLQNVAGNRFRNGNDPVPCTPPSPYSQDRQITQIGVEKLNPIACHMLDSYIGALSLLPPA